MKQPSKVRLSGPLVPFADGFGAALADLGYTPLSAANQLRVMAHLSRWLEVSQLSPRQLTPERAGEFLAARRAAGYTCWRSLKGLTPLLGYLRSVGVVPVWVCEPACDGAGRLVEEYGSYLRTERGLAESTIGRYEEVARRFLAVLAGRGVDTAGVSTALVTGFVREECAGQSVGMAKNLVTGLRAFLRFMHAAGHVPVSLVPAVPSVAGWRIATLPRPPGPAVLAALLASCDRRRAAGLRDHAILTLLIRLGLRAGEVAALELGDLDWPRGEVLVRGKGTRLDRLPLPVDVGEAVAGYLHQGRRPSPRREVFLRMRAPRGPLSRGGVSEVVRQACRRCGIEPFGAHRLRHGTASELLARGVPLEEIAQVLRHRSISSTAIYAKIDHRSLRALARPWPGTAS